MIRSASTVSFASSRGFYGARNNTNTPRMPLLPHHVVTCAFVPRPVRARADRDLLDGRARDFFPARPFRRARHATSGVSVERSRRSGSYRRRVRRIGRHSSARPRASRRVLHVVAREDARGERDSAPMSRGHALRRPCSALGPAVLEDLPFPPRTGSASSSSISPPRSPRGAGAGEPHAHLPSDRAEGGPPPLATATSSPARRRWRATAAPPSGVLRRCRAASRRPRERLIALVADAVAGLENTEPYLGGGGI